MSHVYQSPALRARLRLASRWLLRWCYDSCIALQACSGAMLPPLFDDPRVDGDLVGWAAGQVSTSHRGRRQHHEPGD